VAIVTGGGSGIGRETARLLAAEGAHVVVAGRASRRSNDVVGEIQKAGGKATARQADVSRHVEAGELAHWTLATLGRVDVLVNNAGHSSRARSDPLGGQGRVGRRAGRQLERRLRPDPGVLRA